MNTPLRIVTWTAAGLLGLGIAAGAADAVTTHHATAAKAHAGAKAGGAPNAAGLGNGALLRRLVHGDLTLRTKTGYADVRVQRGMVKHVSPTSLEVVSADGTDWTYVITSATKLRPAAPADGQQVLVVATQSGSAYDATRVRVINAKAKAAQATT